MKRKPNGKPAKKRTQRGNTTGRTQRLLSSFLAAATLLNLAVGGQQKAIAQKPLIETAPSAKVTIGATSSTLKEIRIIYTYEYTTAGSALVSRAAAIYKDGTFTRDFAGVAEYGEADSMQRNPRLWGTWRTNSGGEFEYRYSYSNDWRKPIASVPSINNDSASEQTLQGCYTSQYSVALSGASSLSFNTFCFDANGNVSNQRIRSADSNAGTAGSQRRLTGRYLAIGNLIGIGLGGNPEIQTLGVYGDTSETAVQISINGTVFNRNDD